MLLNTKSSQTFNELFGAAHGGHISHEAALKDSTVASCARVIAQTISTLPVKFYVKKGSDYVEDTSSMQSHTLTAKPNAFQTANEMIEQMVMQIVMCSESFAWVQHDERGRVLSILPFNDPKQVTIMSNGHDLSYRCVTNDGKTTTLPAKSVLHIKDTSFKVHEPLDKIGISQDALSLSSSATRNALSFYKQGSRVGGWITSGKRLSDEAFARLGKQINQQYAGDESSHRLGILEDGLGFIENKYSMRDSMVLDAREQVVRDVAAIFRVPLPLLGVGEVSAHTHRVFYTSCLQAIIVKIQNRFRTILPVNTALQLDTTGYLRGSPSEAAEYVKSLLTAGVISLDDARQYLGLQRIHAQPIYVVGSNNLQFGTIDQFGLSPETNINNTTEGKQSDSES